MGISPKESLQRELERRIEGDVRFSGGTLAIYSTDSSNYRQVPVGVVVPRHEGDVILAAELARENQVPLLARGGGTSLAGQTCNCALILDFSKYMNAIRRIEPTEGYAVVEPGVIQSRLNDALAPHELFFAPDPATKDRCTIGGMIGNNSCGPHSAAYGKTVDNVFGLDVLLYDGTRLRLGGGSQVPGSLEITGSYREAEIYSALKQIGARYGDLVRQKYPHIPRRVSGYNLDQLLPENGFNLARALVGSEGTLAITLAATVAVVPRPKELVLVALGFSDIFVAADQVPWILEHRPEALEAFGREMVEFGGEKGLDGARLLPPGSGYLIVELGAANLDDARARGEALVSAARSQSECKGAVLLARKTERDAVWGLRESGLGAGAPRPGFPPVWPGAEDVAVPPAKLGVYLRRFHQLLQRRQLRVAMYYGHFGEGCVHCRINFDLKTEAGVAIFRATMEEIGDLVAEIGGAVSGEHGDGLARSELLARVFGPKITQAFKEFKGVFDPDGRMNPGNIVDPKLLDSHLRLGADFRARKVDTVLDFSGDGGLVGATLRCVGLGKCRKLDAGTMCPSFMVTRDEIHSTRGRARILFEALTRDVLKDGLDSEDVREALDYCLSCKSCKTECQASVDMSALKAEVMEHYYRRHHRPLLSEFFGRFDEWADLAAKVPGLVNGVADSFLGQAMKRVVGLHPDRELPRFAKRSFQFQFARRARPLLGQRKVVLFPDCFNNYYDPDVLLSGADVLEQAGFEVTLPQKALCCGRTLFSNGMLELARRKLVEAVQVLSPYVEQGIPIIGLEPGCILTFRDELPKILPHSAEAHKLSRAAFMLDEFLAQEGRDFQPASFSANALLHGHCHQKAITGLRAETSLLEQVNGLRFEVLDAGCCGMAGAFGYYAKNFEMSKALAERSLVPAIRASAPGTVVIADGFSCRSQIHHFCPDVTVLHFAQVLSRRSVDQFTEKR